VVIFNKSMEQMLSYEKAEVVGKISLKELFAAGEADKFQTRLGSQEFGGVDRLFLYESNLASRTGQRIPVQLNATLLFQEGEEIGIVVFFRDLREIRKLVQQFADQARMLHQDKMISLGKLAASVVHEINNPLSGILNYTRLMLKILGRGTPPPDWPTRFTGYLTLMDGELSRCTKIVSNLLAFSRKSELEFKSTDVNDLLNRCLLLSQHKLTLQNIQVKNRFSTNLPVILADAGQLQQCVINLIFNAIDAMPNGGMLTLTSTFDSRKDLVEVRVADTGVGIAREDLSYIFDPFFTTKTEGKGLGLGLSTAYGIIDRHGGTIHVESAEQKGTEFILRLPVHGPAAAKERF
jgi:PAS domain S-box-containing protein